MSIWNETEEDRTHEADLASDVRLARQRCKEIADRIAELEVDALRLRAEPDVLPEEVASIEEKVDRLWHEIYRLVACALHWRHSENEVAAWCARAHDLGARHTVLGPALIENLLRMNKVPNAPLLARAEELIEEQQQQAINDRRRHSVPADQLKQPPRKYEKGSTGNTLFMRVAELTGIHRRDVPRYLGHSTLIRRGVHYLHIFIDYDKAAALARALGMSPHDAGL